MNTLPPDSAQKRQRIHRLLTGVILMTLPCYACGIILLVGFGGRQPVLPSPTATLPPTATQETLWPTQSPTLTYTPGGPTVTLIFTPTQFFPPTITTTPSITPTLTITTAPTGTTTSLPPTSTGTTPPTITLPPPTATATATPTNTSIPTLTPTSTFTPTETGADVPITETAAAALTQAANDLTATAQAGGGSP